MSSVNQFEVQYNNDQIIFCEYETGNSFYFIKSGNVKLVKQHDDKESIIGLLSPGVFFGEMGVIESAPRSATAIAEGNTVLLKFSQDNFETLVLKNPSLVTKLIQTFVDRIWEQQQRLQIYSFKDDAPRVVAMLLNLKTNIASDYEGGHVVNVSVDDLSKWAGISLKACKRVLQGFVASKVLTIKEHAIIINNIESLERYISVHTRNYQQ